MNNTLQLKNKASDKLLIDIPDFEYIVLKQALAII